MTKSLIAICLCAAFAFTHAADKPAAAASETIKGEVLETMDSGGFTIAAEVKDGELWTAVRARPSRSAAQSVENGMTMKNFESKRSNYVCLDRAGRPRRRAERAAWQHRHSAPSYNRGQSAGSSRRQGGQRKGANARTVAGQYQGADLKDKPVVVRGKVVKYNGGIMRKLDPSTRWVGRRRR
jgi:hypothetical protein